MTFRNFMDSILTLDVLSMLSSHSDAIYQQDNARLHTVQLYQRYLHGWVGFSCRYRSDKLLQGSRTTRGVSSMRDFFKDMTYSNGLSNHQTSHQQSRFVKCSEAKTAVLKTGDLTAQLRKLQHDFPQEIIGDVRDLMPCHVLTCISTRGIFLLTDFVTFS